MNLNGNGTRRIAEAIIIAAILGAWGFTVTRASDDEVAEARQEAEDAHRRIDSMVVNQAAVITTLDGIAERVNAPRVPEKVLQDAKRITAIDKASR